MAAVTLPPISNSNSIGLDTSIKQKVDSPSIQQINKQLNAEGRTKIGERALEESLRKLSEIFDKNNIQISTVFDAQQGIKQLKILDSKSGRPYMEMPPEAAIQIADNAKHKNIGWLIDLVT